MWTVPTVRFMWIAAVMMAALGGVPRIFRAIRAVMRLVVRRLIRPVVRRLVMRRLMMMGLLGFVMVGEVV